MQAYSNNMLLKRIVLHCEFGFFNEGSFLFFLLYFFFKISQRNKTEQKRNSSKKNIRNREEGNMMCSVLKGSVNEKFQDYANLLFTLETKINKRKRRRLNRYLHIYLSYSYSKYLKKMFYSFFRISEKVGTLYSSFIRCIFGPFIPLHYFENTSVSS